MEAVPTHCPEVKGRSQTCTHILSLPWHPELAVGMG